MKAVLSVVGDAITVLIIAAIIIFAVVIIAVPF
jgi:hypothetical protein